jgi:glycosyltransferase involved in cell wall biosynthesis
LQPVIVGSLASSGMRLPQLNSLVGLGVVFASATLKARAVRSVLNVLLPPLLNRPATTATVENTDDKAVLSALGVRSEQIIVLAGSGVDIHRLQPLPEPDGAITAAFVGRLLGYKGLRTLIAAFALLANRGTALRLLIAGEPDPANPSSIPPEEINSWKLRAEIALLGYVADVSDVWKSAHFAILPSQREGLPVSLLEAAACGRPLVATDVPGCREIARAGVNALLVSPNDPSALAEAIGRMANDSEMRRRFGRSSRQIVEAEYSSDIVGSEVVALYDRLSGRQHSV